MVVPISPLTRKDFKKISSLSVLELFLTVYTYFVCLNLQYLSHLIRPGKHIFDRFAVLFSVVIVWIYAHLLTVGGAYNGTSPKTQASCRTDRAGLIDGAPW